MYCCYSWYTRKFNSNNDLYLTVIKINTIYVWISSDTIPLPPSLAIRSILEDVNVNSIISSSDQLVLRDKTKSIDPIIRWMEGTDDLSIAHEIECPRCQDTTILHYEFNKLCYFEESGFVSHWALGTPAINLVHLGSRICILKYIRCSYPCHIHTGKFCQIRRTCYARYLGCYFVLSMLD